MHCILSCVSSVIGRGSCAVDFFFQAEDGIRYLVRSRGLGDVYKRQDESHSFTRLHGSRERFDLRRIPNRAESVAKPLDLSLIHI